MNIYNGYVRKKFDHLNLPACPKCDSRNIDINAAFIHDFQDNYSCFGDLDDAYTEALKGDFIFVCNDCDDDFDKPQELNAVESKPDKRYARRARPDEPKSVDIEPSSPDKTILITDINKALDKHSFKIALEVFKMYGTEDFNSDNLRQTMANIVTQATNHWHSKLDWGYIGPSRIGTNTAKALIKQLTQTKDK